MHAAQIYLGIRVIFWSAILGSLGALLGMAFSLGFEGSQPHPLLMYVAPATGTISYLGLILGRVILGIYSKENRCWFLGSLGTDGLLILLGGLILFDAWLLPIGIAMLLIQVAGILFLIHGLRMVATSSKHSELASKSKKMFNFLIISLLFTGLGTVVIIWAFKLQQKKPPAEFIAGLAAIFVIVNWVRVIILLEDFARSLPRTGLDTNSQHKLSESSDEKALK